MVPNRDARSASTARSSFGKHSVGAAALAFSDPGATAGGSVGAGRVGGAGGARLAVATGPSSTCDGCAATGSGARTAGAAAGDASVLAIGTDAKNKARLSGLGCTAGDATGGGAGGAGG